MTEPTDDLAEFWEDLLSSQPARIRRAWLSLTDDECLAVLEHLRRMSRGTGWQPAQQQAALEALRVIYEQAQ
jgi:hypothetical protein